ncbi:hypothetical protein ACQ4PT_066096 [Festuca glaucescens]
MASPGGSDRAPKGEDLQASSSSSKSTSSRDGSCTMGTNGSTKPTSLTFRVLKEITDNFSEKSLLGQGAYGKVYKGVLNGEDIAVKLLHNNMQASNNEQFQHEFDNLMMLNHPNIVKFVGYCYEIQRQHVDFKGRIVFGETTYRALCFEYMHMGSLQRHISDEFHGLDWEIRYKIIKGACEGLKYLHEELKEPIYHLDLKPDNILLDENMTPKLADFGLSKLFGEEQTRITHSPIGTIGYMPPEYLFRHVVSKKLDVFSLGVIITKIIAGPKGHTRSAEMPYKEFLDQVHLNWRNRLQETCTSSILEAYCEQVSICTEIGLSSMEADRHKRPSILDIIERLDETESAIGKAISSISVKSQREKDDNLVKIEAFARNKAIQVSERYDEFPVLVQVTGAAWRHAEEMSCSGVDVVVVLNVRMHKVKEAMVMLVDRLSPNDRLSILFVGRRMERVTELTYMSDHGRDVARLKISELAHSHVHENIEYVGPVLIEAAKILRQRGAEVSGIRPGCIMHLWTGRMHPKIDEQEVDQEFPVHIIALPDCDPSDMKQVANMTSGTYSFIQDSDKINNINHAVALFVASITSVIATKINLQVHEGITISSIASGRYSNLVSSDKQSATVDLHNINAGEQKAFIIYLTVPQGKGKLVTIGGRYQSLNMSKELVGMDVVIARPRRKCLPDELIVHPKVAAEQLRIRLMEGIAKQNQDLSRNNLRLLLDDIKNSHEGHVAPEEMLSDLAEQVAEMTIDREYMLSRLNGQQLQGSTTNSTPSNIGSFQTLEQQREDERTNLVKIQGFTRSKAIMGSNTCNEFPVLVRVTVAPWRHGWEMPRDGVDVVAVVHISRNMQGEMQEEMLENVKKSIMIVIDKLSPHDRLSIVLFQIHNLRLMELTYMSDDDHGHGRDAARFKISQLRASSGKYMCHSASAALQEGARVLRDRGAEESTSRLGCMMLLSDGKHPEIFQTEISPEFQVHTFGLGADHNPKVMKHIADITCGTYSFVDQDISNIKGALALFITGLTSIAVASITITLRAYKDIAISSIESGNYIHSLESDKMSGTITIDNIYAGEQKEFIVNLIVGSGMKTLMTIGGQYKGFKWDNSLAEIDMSVTRPWLTRFPDDLAIHPNVAAELVRIRLQNGVRDMLETQKMTTQGLQQLWNMIKHSDEGRGVPEETLSGLSMEVAKMNRDISGMPYTLSWLSCHKWQRATTKGTSSNSSAFRTMGQYADEDTNLVETFTRSKAIPSEDPCNEFPVLVRVMVAPWRHEKQMPHTGVDIVALLDASGRMQGEKLEHMKEAMMVVIDKLRAEDRLSIVSFNTYENRLTKLTYMTDQGQDDARLKIKKLVAASGGQSDISAALREGAEILWWRGAESSSRACCMMLLSVGNYPEIFQTGISPEFPVHTFGFGTDHNPKVMKYIADLTSGTYSFINQGIDRIKGALMLFITGLTSVAAMSIKLTLRTDEGITISSIKSGGYVNKLKSGDRSATVDIDKMYASERKDFIIYLRVAEGKKELMTIGGKYLSHNTVKHLANTDVYVVHPYQECVPGDLAIHPEVAAELVRLRLEKGISTMLDKGLSRVGLQQLWEEIMDSEEGRGAPKDTLSGLSMDVTEMRRDIENPKEHRKSGLPYTLSWLTGRKWQRATIKGTPCSSGAIQTRGQDADGRTTRSQ